LVRKPLAPRARRLDDVLVQSERGEDEDLEVREAARGLQAVHHGHPDVHQDHVGPVALGRRDGLAPVVGLGDDLDRPCRFEHGLEAGAHQRLVVGDQDADHL
jgi:hypothetical protein